MTTTTEDHVREGRWELRVWQISDRVRELLVSLDPSPASSEETDCYLIGPRSEFDAKIREGALDVKELIERRHGFQRWSPAWSQEPPYDETSVDRLWVELGLSKPQQPGGRSLSNEDLIDLIAYTERLRAVEVHKAREHFDLGGALGELTEVRANDHRPEECVVIEGTDIARLTDLRASLELEGLPNVPVHVQISHLLSRRSTHAR